MTLSNCCRGHGYGPYSPIGEYGPRSGAFAALLTGLGYRVTLLSARIFLGGRSRPP
ncbi:hypothetical protein ACWDSD_38920 [Streptomyces spiralis]